MQQALDVLENTARSAVEQYVAEQKAITALRQAIEQAEKQDCGEAGHTEGRCGNLSCLTMREQEPVSGLDECHRSWVEQNNKP